MGQRRQHNDFASEWHSTLLSQVVASNEFDPNCTTTTTTNATAMSRNPSFSSSSISSGGGDGPAYHENSTIIGTHTNSTLALQRSCLKTPSSSVFRSSSTMVQPSYDVAGIKRSRSVGDSVSAEKDIAESIDLNEKFTPVAASRTTNYVMKNGKTQTDNIKLGNGNVETIGILKRTAKHRKDNNINSFKGKKNNIRGKKQRWLISAEHPYKIMWDILTFTISIANAYATHTAIRDRKFDNSTFTKICEIWFMIDIMLNFITEYKTEHGVCYVIVIPFVRDT